MRNVFGQDIVKGCFVIQISRTNQGMVRRVGVVLGEVVENDETKLRTAWHDLDAESGSRESVVGHEALVRVDPSTLPATTTAPLMYAAARGRAAL